MAGLKVSKLAPWQWTLMVVAGCGMALCVLSQIVAESLIPDARRIHPAQTRAKLLQIKLALMGYQETSGSFPTTNDGLVALTVGMTKELEVVPKDGWGSAFIYAMPPAPQDASHPFTLRSAGPDRIAFTADDIDVWTLNH